MNNRVRYQTTQSSKLGGSANTPGDQNVWCGLAELMQLLVRGQVVGMMLGIGQLIQVSRL